MVVCSAGGRAVCGDSLGLTSHLKRVIFRYSTARAVGFFFSPLPFSLVVVSVSLMLLTRAIFSLEIRILVEGRLWVGYTVERLIVVNTTDFLMYTCLCFQKLGHSAHTHFPSAPVFHRRYVSNLRRKLGSADRQRRTCSKSQVWNLFESVCVHVERTLRCCFQSLGRNFVSVHYLRFTRL